jgi:hypothetical protein
MLTVRHIPLNQQPPEDWNRFLYKAAKGSAKATDVLSYANMAYMAALTGDPTSPATLQLTDYQEILRDYFATLKKPDSAHHLAATVDSNNWFAFKLHGHLSPPQESSSYSAIWSKGRSVSQCSLDYNSHYVVAAMLLLALTWKAT